MEKQKTKKKNFRGGFPECPLHSGKAQLHSEKTSPSATLGEEPPANPLTGKSPSPSVKNRALGEGFAECRAGTRGRLDAVGRRCFLFDFLPRVQHSEKIFEFFLNNLCRVPQLRHTAKNFFFKNPLCRVPQLRHSRKPPLKILFLFFPFPCKQQSIYISQTTNQHQYVTNHIYIYTNDQIYPKSTIYYKHDLNGVLKHDSPVR